MEYCFIRGKAKIHFKKHSGNYELLPPPDGSVVAAAAFPSLSANHLIQWRAGTVNGTVRRFPPLVT